MDQRAPITPLANMASLALRASLLQLPAELVEAIFAKVETMSAQLG